MGTGTDVAMQGSAVTLLNGDLTGIVRARELSQATMRNIRQNLTLSFVYNMAGIALAAGPFIRIRTAAFAGRGVGRHGTVVSERHRQRAATALRRIEPLSLRFPPCG